MNESSASANSKRIAKNSLLLYVRMLLMMSVTLYTSRVVLNALGVEDYGIYNVVGGVVAMFSIVSGSLTTSISRFITFELGKNRSDIHKLNITFSTAVTIQILLSLIILLLVEPFGIWFLNNKMVIPEGRLLAANIVFQFSVATFLLNLISVPYNASIIAHEKMSAFAYISIIEAVGKLLIAYLITISPIDKLVFYAILMCAVAVIIRLIYGYYCKQHFEECRYKFIIQKDLLKDMFGFAGWNFIGTSSFILMTQGVNILINMFFGVLLNTARGIATQVDSALMMFANNFTTAINPQIIKSYAAKDWNYMHKLVCWGSKYSFFLLWIFALPILLETEMVLRLWLKNVPDYSVIFLRYTIAISLLSVISNTLVTSMQATGNIKKYQIIVGGLGMTIFPVVYIAYKIGLPVEVAYYVHFMIFVLQLITRLVLLRKMINLPVLFFLKNAIFRDFYVMIVSAVIPFVVCTYIEDSLLRMLYVVPLCILITLSTIYFVGVSAEERKVINAYMLKFVQKIIPNV